MTIIAARYAGVPAWELEEQSIMWEARYLAVQAAEADAEKYHQQQAAKKRR